jgi:hypothetical protein
MDTSLYREASQGTIQGERLSLLIETTETRISSCPNAILSSADSPSSLAQLRPIDMY